MQLVNNELQQMLKKVTASLNVLFWHLPEETMEHHIKISVRTVGVQTKNQTESLTNASHKHYF
jgi:hypothetical protein